MAGYISEIMYQESQDNFIEVAVPRGTDVSGYSVAIYDASGVLQTTMSFDLPDGTMGGSDVYTFDQFTTGYAQYGASEAIALIDGSGNVLQFVSFEGKTVTPSSGPAAGVTSTDLGFTQSLQSLETSDGGTTYNAQAAPNPGTIPCYAPDTLIATADGPKAAGALRRGDRVLCEDSGPQPVLWTRRMTVELEAGSLNGRPVRIRAGALGPGVPSTDLIVSPQHRILVGGHGQLEDLFDTESFVPAKALTVLRGVRFMHGRKRAVWVHFACARHEVVTAAGARSESLLLGDMVLRDLPERQRRRLSAAFPGMSRGKTGHDGPARGTLSLREARETLRAKAAVRSKRAPLTHRVDEGHALSITKCIQGVH